MQGRGLTEPTTGEVAENGETKPVSVKKLEQFQYKSRKRSTFRQKKISSFLESNKNVLCNDTVEIKFSYDTPKPSISKSLTARVTKSFKKTKSTDHPNIQQTLHRWGHVTHHGKRQVSLQIQNGFSSSFRNKSLLLNPSQAIFTATSQNIVCSKAVTDNEYENQRDDFLSAMRQESNMWSCGFRDAYGRLYNGSGYVSFNYQGVKTPFIQHRCVSDEHNLTFLDLGYVTASESEDQCLLSDSSSV